MKRSFTSQSTSSATNSNNNELSSPLKRLNNPYSTCSTNNNFNENNNSNTSYEGSVSVPNTSSSQDIIREKHHMTSESTRPDDDDLSTFDWNLETTPEYGEVLNKMDLLSLEDEKGDELQNKAIQLGLNGKNIFLTGKAGTGKSWTTRQMLKQFERKRRIMHVTAPTGIAAIQSHGITINSWGGFGLGEYYADFDRMMDKKIRLKIVKADVLLIEEVSMVNGHLLDVLECMVTIIREYNNLNERIKQIKNDADTVHTMSPLMLERRWGSPENGGLGDIKPWGGLQIILVGDFFQLPPIPNTNDMEGNEGKLHENEELTEEEHHLKIGRKASYAFESRIWQNMELEQVELEEMHRQKEDDGLFAFLNALREGDSNITAHEDVLRALRQPLPKRTDGIIPTELHSKNKIVEERNTMELERLQGEKVAFKSIDEVSFANDYKGKLLKKYGLQNYTHMPNLFAAVEKPRPSMELVEARMRQSNMESKTKELIAKEDWESLMALSAEKKELEDRVSELERKEKEKLIISLDSVKKFLETIPNPQITPEDLLQKSKLLQRQLLKDFHVLEKHAQKQYFDSNCRVGSTIEFKENAQVMLLWNLDVKAGLANGSRGIVKHFVPTKLYHHLLLKEARERASKSNSQGSDLKTAQPSHFKDSQEMSLHEGPTTDSSTNDIEKTVDAEVLHCKDSQEKSQHDGPTTDPNTDDIENNVDPEVLLALKERIDNMGDLRIELMTMDMLNTTMNKIIPLVYFANGLKRVILPQPFRKEFRGCGTAARYQIPLTLAWAISIHKSQGTCKNEYKLINNDFYS